MSAEQSQLEIRFQDANHALFMVLTECAQIALAIGSDHEAGDSATVAAAALCGSGKGRLSNREIAEYAFRINSQLAQLSADPRSAQVRRVLMQVMLADRWEAKFQTNDSAGTDPAKINHLDPVSPTRR